VQAGQRGSLVAGRGSPFVGDARSPVKEFVVDYHKSVAQYPNIKTGEEFEGYPLARP
jgi:hypothetical protein